MRLKLYNLSIFRKVISKSIWNERKKYRSVVDDQNKSQIKLDDVGNPEIRPKQAIIGGLILEISEENDRGRCACLLSRGVKRDRCLVKIIEMWSK